MLPFPLLKRNILHCPRQLKKLCGLRQLFSDLQSEPCGPTVLHEDNQAAICLSKNPQGHGKSKHIEIKYHFIREQVKNGAIKLQYCQTSDMVADVLTKGLAKDTFEKLRALTGLSSYN